MKFLSLISLALLSVNALKLSEEPSAGGDQGGSQLPDLFGESMNGVANFKGTETTEMYRSSKTMAGLVFLYDPSQEETKKLVPEYLKVAKEMNERGTGIRIEAVNVSWTANKKSLGVEKFPAFKLFHFGDDTKGENVPEAVVTDGTKDAFLKYLEDKGFSKVGKGDEKKKSAKTEE